MTTQEGFGIGGTKENWDVGADPIVSLLRLAEHAPQFSAAEKAILTKRLEAFILKYGNDPDLSPLVEDAKARIEDYKSGAL